ncbi:MAG: glycosyltransferase family 2 protein [Leptospirales bacterium]
MPERERVVSFSGGSVSRSLTQTLEYPEGSGVSLSQSGGSLPESFGTVAAIVVTYNRKKLLVECLEGLARQTYPLSAILIIDNASSDGTSELLHERGFIPEPPLSDGSRPWELQGSPPGHPGILLTYRRLPENTGGAGGFHEGVKAGFESGYDWLWLMDDDVEPTPSCLSSLLSFSGISLCIHPSKQFEDGLRFEWEGYISPKTGRRIFLQDPSFKKGLSYCETNTGCFEGMLVHRSIVEKIGFPDKRFFIGSDDSVYGFLAHHHTRVLYTRDPLMLKKARSSVQPISDRSLYYGMRNSFLRHSYLNRSVGKHRFIRSLFLVVKFFDFFSNILMSRKNKRPAIRLLLRATRDGLAGRFGKGL